MTDFDLGLNVNSSGKSVTATGVTNLTATVSAKGPTGPTGATGATGSTGATGATGPANSLSIGTVSAGSAGASITGSAPTQTLNLTLPTGIDATFSTSGVVKQTVYNVKDYLAVGDGITDDSTAVASAITALNAAGGGILLFPIGGNYVLSPIIQLSSNTHVINEGTITLNPAYTVVGTTFRGIFRLGSTSGTAIVDNVEIEGGKVVGDCFSPAYTTNSPTFNANNHKYVCFVHSVATHRNVKVHDIKITNMGSPVTFEKLGGNNGTPSQGVHVYNLDYDQVWVGVQYYCNGYAYEDCSIHDITVHFSYDDAVAVVGADGGTGGSGLVQRVQVYNIRGEKTGQTGAFVKLDATGGSLSDINVSNISGYTNGVNEYLVGIIGASAANNKKYDSRGLQSQGTWSYGFYAQTNGRSVRVSKFHFEALHGLHFQGNATPHVQQSIQVGHGIVLSRSASAADTVEGNGIGYSAGTGAQGFQNVYVDDVEFRNKAIPINEGATVPSGTGVQGTYQNFNYSIDVRNSATSDCDFSSTTRRVRFYKEGVYTSDDSLALVTALPVTSGGTGSSSASGARTNLGVGTGDSPQFTGINVGNASDTTITRNAAGDISVEGNLVYRAGGTDVPVTDGGTGASTAANARTNLGAAASGANTDITSLASLSTPLSVAQGGSGTGTAFTTGSIVFAGGSGVYSQDNSNLFFDDTNNRLGVGTASPQNSIHLIQNSALTGNTIGATFEQAGSGDTALQFLLTGVQRWMLGVDNSDSDRFKIAAGSALGGVEMLSIDTSGNTGVGAAANTNTKLDITGNTRTSGTLSAGIGIRDTGAGTPISGKGISMYYHTSDYGVIEVADWGTIVKNLRLNPAGGNVSIGNVTPTSALHVNGPIATVFVAKTANYTVTSSDSVLTGDCTSGNLTFTLPAAASIAGRQYTFKRIDASANSVIIDGNASETIDGATTYTLTTRYQSISIISDGTNWIIV